MLLGTWGADWVRPAARSETLYLISRHLLNLPMLNLVLSDGRVGTFAEVNELNKQALFALRFQRTPEEFATTNLQNPTVFDFNLPDRGVVGSPEPLQNRQSLAALRSGKPNSVLPPLGTLPQQIPTDLSMNFNNNVAEILNTHLPSGITLLDLSAALYDTELETREIASRVFFQLMVEADYLQYPWFSAQKPKRRVEEETARELVVPEDIAFLEGVLRERSAFLDEWRANLSNYKTQKPLSSSSTNSLNILVQKYGTTWQQLNEFFESDDTVSGREESNLPLVFQNEQFLRRLSELSQEPRRRPYGTNLIDL